MGKPHYLRGGAIGRNTLIWDPVGQLIRGEPITDTLAEDVRAKKRERELANGRLAMIGAMGFSAHYMIEGSVPAVIGNYYASSPFPYVAGGPRFPFARRTRGGF